MASAPSAPSYPTTVSIANDPMFVVNGVHRHFWLPTAQMVPLMSWFAVDPHHPKKGTELVLSGETFGHGATQWFGSYTITADGKEALKVTIADEPAEESKNDAKKLQTIGLWVDGKAVMNTGTTVSNLVSGLSVTATALPKRTVGSSQAENAEITAPGLNLAISSAGAKKYEKENAQVRWAHLNMKMKSQLPSDVKGMVAELAGLQSLSKETKSYLTVPKIMAEKRMRKRRAAQKGKMHRQEASTLQA